MRKNQLTLLALLIFQFACEPTEDTGPGPVTSIDYFQVSHEFDDMFKGAFGITGSLQLASIVDQTKNQLMVKIEVENFSKAFGNEVSDYYNIGPEYNSRPFYPTPSFLSRFSDENFMETVDNVIDTSRIFNSIQKMYIKTLSRDIASLDNYVDGFSMVTAFRNQITHSKELEENDKILLLEFASGANALLEFMENDGALAVQRSLQEMLGNSVSIGRTLGCSVEWRSVWAGAVVGLAAGVVYGGIIGATTGTFTVPILGTAVGGVGGAVFAGAWGFTSGAVYGITSNLLTSCFRSGTLQQNYYSCEEAWEAYLSYQTNTFPSDCFIVPILI